MQEINREYVKAERKKKAKGKTSSTQDTLDSGEQ